MNETITPDFKRSPTIMTADELIDAAFRAASKVNIKTNRFENPTYTIAKVKLNTARNYICSKLDSYVRAFPDFNRVHKFYYKLTDALVGVDELQIALSGLSWASSNIRSTVEHILSKYRGHKHIPRGQILNEGYGRIVSFLKRIDKSLRFVAEARIKLKNCPYIDTNIKTIVVAGYPNVGKSSLVKRISTAKPRIESYPFTTTGLIVGYFEHNFERFQIIDTPGLLDRPFKERNKIELLAIAAIKYIANLVIFLIDPTETGYPLENQKHLLQSVKNMFKGKSVIVAETKADIIKTESKYIKISSETGENIDILIKACMENIERSS